MKNLEDVQKTSNHDLREFKIICTRKKDGWKDKWSSLKIDLKTSVRIYHWSVCLKKRWQLSNYANHRTLNKIKGTKNNNNGNNKNGHFCWQCLALFYNWFRSKITAPGALSGMWLFRVTTTEQTESFYDKTPFFCSKQFVHFVAPLKEGCPMRVIQTPYSWQQQSEMPHGLTAAVFVQSS